MTKHSGEIAVVVLEGSPRQRGRIHGETLRDQIREYVGRWKDILSESSGVSSGEYLDRFLGETRFQSAIERWTPHLLEEVQGLAEGADIPFREAYAYQLVDEQWIFTRQLREERVLAGAEHCTVVGAFDWADAPPILAQNMDLPKFYDGSQVLLHMKHENSDLESYIFTLAGVLATTGVNNRGVGVCCNTVSQLRSSRDGLPVLFIVRKVLEAQSRAEATAFVRGVTHASGQNYTIGGPDGITSLECSANRAVPFEPLAGRVFHTNHPVVNDELEPQGSGASTSIPDPITGRHRTNTEIRFDAAAQAMSDPGEVITVERVEALLSDEASLVCAMRDGPTPSFTAGSLVMELSVPPVLNLAPGPPSVTEYRARSFN